MGASSLSALPINSFLRLFAATPLLTLLSPLVELPNPPTINDQVMAVHEAAFIACKKQRGVSDIRCISGSRERRGFRKIAFELRELALILLIAQRVRTRRAAPEN